MQSSITAWLKKPAAVTKGDKPRPVQSQPLVLPTLSKQPSPPQAAEVQPSEPLPSLPPIPTSYSLPALPPNVELVPLTKDLIPSFKRLNALTLPVAYPSAFYAETMTEPHHSITLVALWHSEPSRNSSTSKDEKPRLVGAIRCRLLSSSILYISTLCLLAPYRSHGIATHLLQRITAKAAEEHGVKSVAAHVWEANDDGLEWYKKRGFEFLEKEEGYYTKLKPSGAILVRKPIGVGDLLPQLDGLGVTQG